VTAPSPTVRAAPGSSGEPTAAAPLLRVEGLQHRWRGPKPPVLVDVDLRLAPGEVAWIGGRNGVGKTTLLRLAAGVLLPQQGSVSIGDVPTTARGGRYQRLVGFLSAGDRGLYARLRVEQQLDYWARLAYVPRGERPVAVDKALDAFELRELADRRVDRLSMGQRQRVRLAMAFLHEPAVLLLDEPRNSLDDDGYALLNGQLAGAARRGAAALWCSPRGEDRVLSVDAGYTLAEGRLERIA
jgi:ABC-2 type transport system ATP-binding protein